MRFYCFIVILLAATFTACSNVEEITPILAEQEITSKTVFDAEGLARMEWRYVTEAEVEEMVEAG